MALFADLAFLGPLAFLAAVALNLRFAWRHRSRFLEALLGRGFTAVVTVGSPPGESNVIALRPRGDLSPAGPALRLAA